MSDNKNSMQKKIDGRYIANQALMERGSHPLKIFVEGKNDKKCLLRFFKDENVAIISSNNKKNAIDALRYYIQSKNKKKVKAISIVDSDYDRILKVSHDEGVFSTDDHDLLVQAINSQIALKLIVNENKNKSKIDIAVLKRKLFESCETLGYLRLINSEDDLGINFDNKDLFKLKRKKLILQIFIQQPNLVNSINKKDLLIKLKNKKSESHSLNIICQGHDLCQSLSFSLGIKCKDIEKLLMACYDIRCFKKTILFNDLKKWGNSNSIDLFDD